MAQMVQMTATPLRELSASWSSLPQVRVNDSAAASASASASASMSAGPETVLLPATSHYLFNVKGNCIEGDELPTAVDVQFEQ